MGLLLSHSDISCSVDESNQLDSELVEFIEYSWKRTISIKQYIAGFCYRLDKIASLQLDDKLKGHLFDHQACRPQHRRNILIGASSGSYDIRDLTTDIRNSYGESIHPSHPLTPTYQRIPTYLFGKKPHDLSALHNRSIHPQRAQQRRASTRRASIILLVQNNDHRTGSPGPRTRLWDLFVHRR